MEVMGASSHHLILESECPCLASRRRGELPIELWRAGPRYDLTLCCQGDEARVALIVFFELGIARLTDNYFSGVDEMGLWCFVDNAAMASWKHFFGSGRSDCAKARGVQ